MQVLFFIQKFNPILNQSNIFNYIIKYCNYKVLFVLKTYFCYLLHKIMMKIVFFKKYKNMFFLKMLAVISDVLYLDFIFLKVLMGKNIDS